MSVHAAAYVRALIAGRGASTPLLANEKGLQKENASTSKVQRKRRKSERKRREKSAAADKCEAMGAGALWGRGAQVHHGRGIRGDRAFIRATITSNSKGSSGSKIKRSFEYIGNRITQSAPPWCGAER